MNCARSDFSWLDFTWLKSSYDEDDVNDGSMIRTMFLHVILSFARWYAWCTVRFKSSQSSLMLSSHLFLGLPLGRCPWVYPCSRYVDICPFPCETRVRNKSIDVSVKFHIIFFSIWSSSSMSTFRFRCLTSHTVFNHWWLTIPQLSSFKVKCLRF